MPNDDALALADRIAQLAITTYTSLPRNLKPTVRSNGVPEWTILSAIILSHPTPEDGDETQLQLVSLGTGVKCLPTNRLPPCGDTLHDCHAEVLAKRGFGRYLLEEAVNSCEGRESRVIERVQRKFRLRVGVGVHLYISALPVGRPVVTVLSWCAERAVRKCFIPIHGRQPAHLHGHPQIELLRRCFTKYRQLNS